MKKKKKTLIPAPKTTSRIRNLPPLLRTSCRLDIICFFLLRTIFTGQDSFSPSFLRMLFHQIRLCACLSSPRRDKWTSRMLVDVFIVSSLFLCIIFHEDRSFVCLFITQGVGNMGSGCCCFFLCSCFALMAPL